MKVLGISSGFHDSAAALVVDGHVVAAAQEERFSRRKHDAAIPVEATRACLEQGGLSMADVDHVVFYEKPLRKFDRVLSSGLAGFPRSLPFMARSLRGWLGEKLWLRGELCRSLGCAPEQLLFCDHHLSHAASTFLASPHASAAILTVDGVGEWTTTAIHHGRTGDDGTTIEPLGELHFPHSIGLLYSAVTAYLGFEVNEGEYKVMGLAGYGTPRYLDAFSSLCRVDDTGSIELDLDYFAFHVDPTRSFSPAMEDMLGPARVPGSPLTLPPRSADESRWADIAASLQRFTEDYLLLLARRAHALTGERVLCMAGGVALNCVANRRIAEEGPFDQVWIPPAAGDAGGALGAALWVTHGLHGLPRPRVAPSAFLGTASSNDEVRELLADVHAPHRAFDDDNDLFAHAAARLARGEVGGFFRGRFEWGPRALGARSIVADPRTAAMKERVNSSVKFREAFRPFAPAVLAEESAEYFDRGRGADDALTTHMLSVRPVTEHGRRTLPAATHVDGTARVQEITPSSSPHLHALLVAFRAATGVGALLNTSLNLKDEPLVSSPVEALALFARSGLDFLVLENCIVTREAA